MTPEDQSALRVVHGILVRHYVDTHKLDVDVIHNTVHIDGEFLLVDGAYSSRKDDPAERDSAARRVLLELEREIRRMTSTNGIHFHLTNWERVGQQWTRKGKK
jgi:hypothetical protein